MSARQILLLLCTLTIGILAGMFVATRYAEERFGRDLLHYVQKDSAQRIASYQKIEALLSADDRQALIDYLNNQTEMAQLALRSAEAAMALE